MKLNELIFCMEHKDLSLKTKKTYTNMYRRFSLFMSAKSGLELYDLEHECLRERNVLEFKKHLEEVKASTATIALAINALKVLIRVAKEDHGLDLGSHKIRIPKNKKSYFKGQTFSDLDKIYNLLESEHPKTAMMIALMVLCGLRVSEVRDLTLGQVQDNFLMDVQGKGERIRDLPLPDRFKNVLARFMEWRINYPMALEYPFIISVRGAIEGNINSYKFNSRTIYQRVKEALTKINCPITNPHSLRHTYCYNLIDKLGQHENPTKVQIAVKNFMGHADIKTTMHYWELPPDVYQKMVKKI